RNPNAIEEYDGNELISTMNPDQSIVYFGIDIDEFTTEDNNSCETPESTDENPQYYPPSDLSGLIEFLTIETLGFEQ
ncbi:MAG TPA: hypothetical protein DD671_08455, partial [Balneolaceae bacterium]|nr:hypothetical protein [Balneolaceae bacterium]